MALDNTGRPYSEIFSAPGTALNQWDSNPATTVGLTRGYLGGPALDLTGAIVSVGGGTVALADNTTNYVERTYAGVVSARTGAWTVTNIPMWVDVTAGGVVVSHTSLLSPFGPFPYFQKRSTEVSVASTLYNYNDPRRFGCDPTEAVPCNTAFANMRTSFDAIAQASQYQANPIVWPEGRFLFTEEPAVLNDGRNFSGMKCAGVHSTLFKFNPTVLKTRIATRSVTSAENRAPTAAENLTDATVGTLVDTVLPMVSTDIAGTGANGSFARTDGRVWVAHEMAGVFKRFYDVTGTQVLAGITITDNTATTLTFTGDVTGATTVKVADFSVVAGAFHRTAGSFLDDLLVPGMVVTATGWQTGTDGGYTVATVTASDVTTVLPIAGNQNQISSGNPRTLAQSTSAFIDMALEVVAGTGAGQRRVIRRCTNAGNTTTWLVDAWQQVVDATSTYRVIDPSVLWHVQPANPANRQYYFSLSDFTVTSDVTAIIPVAGVRVACGHGFKMHDVRVAFNDANDQWSQPLIIAGYDESEFSRIDLTGARPWSFQRETGFAEGSSADTMIFRDFKCYATPTIYGSTRTPSGTVSIDTSGNVTFSASQAGAVVAGDCLTIGAAQYFLASFDGTTGGTTTVNPTVAIVTSAFMLAWHATPAGLEFSPAFAGGSRLRFQGQMMFVGPNGAVHCVAPTYMYDVSFETIQYEGGYVMGKTRPSVNLSCAGALSLYLGKVSLGAYNNQTPLRLRGINGITVDHLLTDGAVYPPVDVDGSVQNFRLLNLTASGGGAPTVEGQTPAPLQPSVAAVGTNDAAKTDTYVVVARTVSGGATSPSAAKQFAANTTLDGTHYNAVTWGKVTAATNGAMAAYDVHKTDTSREAIATGTMSAADVFNPADGGYTTTYTFPLGDFGALGFKVNMPVSVGAFSVGAVRYVATVGTTTMVMQEYGVAGVLGSGPHTLTGRNLGLVGSVSDTGAATYTFNDTGTGPASSASAQRHNSTGVRVASATGLLRIQGDLWSSAWYVKPTVQEVEVIGGELGWSGSVFVQAGTSVVLDTAINQVAGSGDSLELEARWTQGSGNQGHGGKWLFNGASANATPDSVLLYGSPDASDDPADADCIVAVCGNENSSNGYVTLYNNKTVDRWVYFRWRTVKGKPDVQTPDGVTYPNQRLKSVTEKVDSPAIVAGVLTLNLLTNHFVVTRNANITSIVLANVPTLDPSVAVGVRKSKCEFRVVFQSSGPYTVVLPSAWKSASGVPYTAWHGAGRFDALDVWSYDGTTWYYTAVGGGSTSSAASSVLTGLLEYWKMDGSSAGVNANNGTDTAVAYTPGNGIINAGAGMTNAAHSKIALVDATALKPTTAMSVSAWVKLLDTSLSYGVAQNFHQTGSVISGWALIGNGGTWNFSLGNNTNLIAGDGYRSAIAPTATAGVWQHLVATYDGANLKIYLNNALQDTQAWTKTIAYASNTPGIGFRNLTSDSGWMNGAIDEVGLWSRALTLAEIDWLYNGGAGVQYPF